jgi:hypothetical protein
MRGWHACNSLTVRSEGETPYEIPPSVMLRCVTPTFPCNGWLEFGAIQTILSRSQKIPDHGDAGARGDQ